MSVSSLFRPHTVAVIGASSKRGTLQAMPVANLIKYGFEGDIFPVNPGVEEIEGLPSYQSLAELPVVPDTAIITVRATQVYPVLEQCARMGIKSATVLASGFGESKSVAGYERRRALAELVQRSGIRLLGPGSIGIVNIPDRYIPRAAAFLPDTLIEGQISVVAQSGGISLTVLNRAQSAGVGLRYVIPTGLELDLDVNDAIQFLLDDGGTRVIGLFVEAIQNGRRFLALAHDAQAAGVHLVAMKVGRSGTGASAVLGHTGNVAGDYESHIAAFRAAGVHVVDNIDTLWQSAEFLSRFGPLRGTGVGLVTVSGGESAMLADEAAELGLLLPPLSVATSDTVSDRLAFTEASNPLDLTGQLFSGDRSLAAHALSAVLHDDTIEAVLVAITPLGIDMARWLGALFSEAASSSGCPLVVSWWSAGMANWSAIEHLRGLGLMVYESPIQALHALHAAVGHQVPLPPSAGVESSAEDLATTRIVGGAEAYELVQDVLPLAEAKVVSGWDQAVAAAHAITYPVVLKLAKVDLHHKARVGGVASNLTDDTALSLAWERLCSVADSLHLRTPRFQVQKMHFGLQLFLSVRWDPSFGSILVIGAGGTLIEMVDDTVTLLSEEGGQAVRRGLDRLRLLKHLPNLGEVQDPSALNLDSFVEIAEAASNFISSEESRVDFVECNPVIVPWSGASAVAVDAICRLRLEEQ